MKAAEAIVKNGFHLLLLTEEGRAALIDLHQALARARRELERLRYEAIP